MEIYANVKHDLNTVFETSVLKTFFGEKKKKNSIYFLKTKTIFIIKDFRDLTIVDCLTGSLRLFSV